MDKTSWIILIFAGLLIAASILVGIFAPCDFFTGLTAQNIPARCLNYFTTKQSNG